MTIRPDPQEHDQGHCLLPEININDYQESDEKKKHIKEMAAHLALASTIILEAV